MHNYDTSGNYKFKKIYRLQDIPITHKTKLKPKLKKVREITDPTDPKYWTQEFKIYVQTSYYHRRPTRKSVRRWIRLYYHSRGIPSYSLQLQKAIKSKLESQPQPQPSNEQSEPVRIRKIPFRRKRKTYIESHLKPGNLKDCMMNLLCAE